MLVKIQKMEWNKNNQLIVSAEKIVEFTAIQTYRNDPVVYLRWPQTGVLSFNLNTGYGDEPDVKSWRIAEAYLVELREKAGRKDILCAPEDYTPPRPAESRKVSRAPKVDPRQVSLLGNFVD